MNNERRYTGRYFNDLSGFILQYETAPLAVFLRNFEDNGKHTCAVMIVT